MRHLLTLLASLTFLVPALAVDWLHWRGPEQNGVARDTGLPAKWSPQGENLIWKQPYGGRSTPVVSRGRVYIINQAGTPQTIDEQERVMCFDAQTGKVLWEHRFNVFHTDIVTNRVGWANLAADPETGYVYAHGIQGLFFCFDPDGKVVWSKSLTEEYGRITGYGGRVTSPIVDGDLVIIHFLNASWGDQGRGGHRFLALNKKNGEVVYWSEPGGQPLDTIYPVPVVAVIGGQRLLICSGADGAIHAIKARTGEKVWSIPISKRGLNASPVVAGNLVYATHSEENLDSSVQGLAICLDASKVAGGQPAVVWKREGILAGYASPIVHEGRLFIPDNSAKLYCLDAKTGETLWEHKYGTVAKGSPVWCDGKIYVAEVSGRFHVLQPGDKDCKTIHTVEFPPGPAGQQLEINGSPAVCGGRLYFTSGDTIFCIGTSAGKGPSTPPPGVKEEPADPNAKPAHLAVYPADVVLKPGESVKFTARAFDDKGRFLKEVTATWSLPQPPAPPTPPGGRPSPQPPALKGEITPDGTLTVAKDVPAQASIVAAKFGDLTGRARVRVAPVLPIAQDFEKVPDGAIPGGWVNVAGKFVVETKDGSKVLKKRADNANPLLARAIAYIGMPQLTDYTIEAELMGTEKRRNLPDMGVINCRYSLTLDGNKQRLLLRTWEANKGLEAEVGGRVVKKLDFAWKPNVWYHFKLQVVQEQDKAVCRGKVWPRGEKEPDAWTLEVEDPVPNREGSPGLYAYAQAITERSPGTEVFYDNVMVTPNKK
jgi:outer membrane protein assembly factor BamB